MLFSCSSRDDRGGFWDPFYRVNCTSFPPPQTPPTPTATVSSRLPGVYFAYILFVTVCRAYAHPFTLLEPAARLSALTWPIVSIGRSWLLLSFLNPKSTVRSSDPSHSSHPLTKSQPSRSYTAYPIFTRHFANLLRSELYSTLSKAIPTFITTVISLTCWVTTHPHPHRHHRPVLITAVTHPPSLLELSSYQHLTAPGLSPAFEPYSAST